MQFNNSASTKIENMTTPHLRKSIGRSHLRLAFLLIPLVFACFALSPTARGVLPLPTPDGGYPGQNTAEGTNALFSLTTGTQNTAIGSQALENNTTGSYNTALGFQALARNVGGSGFPGSYNTAIGNSALPNNTTGFHNTATGHAALASNRTGVRNTADGKGALNLNTTGGFNVATGNAALVNNTTGSKNIALGFFAGDNLTTGDNNIDIANIGVAAEANTIRIGTEVAVTDQFGVVHPAHTKTFIAGIHGATASGAVTVYVNSSGQLGTLPSSARFKQDIHCMDKASEVILALKPVTFHYKTDIDPKGIPQFGLVAEEVEKVNPDLVTRDDQGKVYTVRYEAVNAMLLNEFLKEHRKNEEQQATITDLKSTVARQQKQIEALTAGLQKVSAQLEAGKPAQQVVNNP
jgi:trimeric autotransporter adhesin